MRDELHDLVRTLRPYFAMVAVASVCLLLTWLLTACAPRVTQAPGPTGHPATVTRYTPTGEANMLWRLAIYAPDGTFDHIVSLNDPVSELESFSIAGDGDNREATLHGLVDTLNIGPRDIVALETSSDDGASWDRRYRGIAVKPGAPRQLSSSAITLVGLRQRLKETINTKPVMTGDDVAAMVRDLLLNITLPGGLTYQAAKVPDVTLTAGDRYPNAETVADTLDALAALLPGFTVAAASTYTYDGTTYNPGDVIPPVTWGVDAAGVIFFRRNFGQTTLSEGVSGVTVDWEELDADQILDHPVLALLSAPTPQPIAPYLKIASDYEPYQPGILTYGYQSPGSPYDVERLIPYPLSDLLVRDSQAAVTLATVQGAVNPTNAFDGDPNTYATDDGTGLTSIGITMPGQAIGVRIVYSVQGGDALRPQVQLLHDDGGSPTTYGVIQWELAETSDKRTVVAFAPPDVHLVGSLTRSGMSFGAMDNTSLIVKIYEMTFLELDTDALDRVAQSLLKIPVELAGTVIRYGDLVAPQPRLQLTLADTTVVMGDVPELSYSLTRAEGVVTRLKLGQAFPATDAAARDLMQARINQGVLTAIRSR